MHNTLSIVPDTAHGFRLLLSGKDTFKLVPYNVRLALWEKAVTDIEKDVSDAAVVFNKYENGEFLWCLTWENHRNDGLMGTVYHYYLINIIYYLFENHSINQILLCPTIPLDFHEQLKIVYPDIVKKKRHNVKTLLQSLRPGISAIQKIVLLIFPALYTYKPSSKSFPSKGIFLQVKDDFKKNRYGLVLSALDTNRIIAFHKDIWRKPLEHPFGNNYINFSSYISWSVIKNAFKITKQVAKIKKKEIGIFKKNLFLKSVKYELRSQVFLNALKVSVFESALNHLNPQAVFTVTSITDPVSRIPETVAYRAGISSCVVACRSMISRLRAEDRIAYPDLNHYNNTGMGSHFIVRDAFSKNTWQSMGLESSKILVLASDNTNPHNNYIIEDGIILLLTQYVNNQILFELLSQVQLKGFKKIYLRSHPNRRAVNEVTQEQLDLLSLTGLECVDVTDIKMHDMECKNSIAVTTNSTAGVEVVSTGAPIIWLPFVNENTIQFADVMNCLGHTCVEKDSFIKYIQQLDENPNMLHDFINKTNKQYADNFVNRENISIHEFLQKIL